LIQIIFGVYHFPYQTMVLVISVTWGLVWFMVFNATFNNISVISWRSVLLVEETRVPGEIYRPATSHWQALSHNVMLSTPPLGEMMQLCKCFTHVSKMPHRGHRGRDRMVVLQLRLQSVPITTKVLSSNPNLARCTQCNIVR
jgi:hypothetical protein